MSNKLGARNWITFIMMGLIGQFAWTIENMYLNSYVFALTGDSSFIPAMVAASAVTATLTTLLMGALSDRLGKRKLFISFGYVIWGITLLLFPFALLIRGTAIPAIGNTLFLTGLFVVIMDCLMTFFGSTANDAAFNAYVTDATNTNNRGKVESILSILPLVSMLVMFVAGGFVLESYPIGGVVDGVAQEANPLPWVIFFSILGAIVIIAGIVNFFVMPKDLIKPNKEEPYFKNIFYGFRPSVIKKNKMLYVCLIAFCLFSIAIQVFFPYFIIYVQKALTGVDFILTLGIVLVVSCIITVVFGIFMDKIGKSNIMIPALACTVVGALLLFFLKDQIGVIFGGLILMSGYMVSTAVLNAKIRDYTPEAETGLFQGIRMIFSVAIPMCTGPYIGEALFKATADKNNTYIEFGEEKILPNEWIFLGAAIVLVIAIIPLIFIILEENKFKKNIINDSSENDA